MYLNGWTPRWAEIGSFSRFLYDSTGITLSDLSKAVHQHKILNNLKYRACSSRIMLNFISAAAYVAVREVWEFLSDSSHVVNTHHSLPILPMLIF